MNVLVTGSRGFIGKNLVERLKNLENVSLSEFYRGNTLEQLQSNLSLADVVYHLAGTNRPNKIEKFEVINTQLTRTICNFLTEIKRNPRIIFSSSIQAGDDNPYGVSKRNAELALIAFAKESNSDVRIYRLRNVFGAGGKPNYNSVVTTFCYNIARGLPIQINDPKKEIDLVYIDNIISSFISDLEGKPLNVDIPFVRISLGSLAEHIQEIHEKKKVPKLEFDHQLYQTYLSYMPEGTQ